VDQASNRLNTLVIPSDTRDTNRSHHYHCKIKQILHRDAQRVGLASDFERRNFGAVDPLQDGRTY
jgi:hypothetical protein